MKMQYEQINGLGRPVSRFVFGTAHPVFFAATRTDHGEEPGFQQALDKAFALLDAVFAMGINTLDCSNHYGEEPVGEWLHARGLHDQVNILTKGAHHNTWRKRVTPYDILADAHDSLAKLGKKTLEIYLLHRDDVTQPVGPIMEALNQLRQQGKVGLIGVSNWTLPRVQEANEYAEKHGLVPFAVNSPHYGLAHQLGDVWGGGCETLTGPQNKKAREWYLRQQMPIFAYSSLARGLFSGEYHSQDLEKMKARLDEPAQRGYLNEDNLRRLARAESLAREKGCTVSQIALAFMLCQPLRIFPVISTAHPERMRENISALNIPLSPEQCAWLDLERDSPTG